MVGLELPYQNRPLCLTQMRLGRSMAQFGLVLCLVVGEPVVEEQHEQHGKVIVRQKSGTGGVLVDSSLILNDMRFDGRRSSKSPGWVGVGNSLG